ncbi:hypothetical protein A2U01_0040292, partial [Trifolium medium]|nr:hypothetical protein [Trifolium medium]
MSGGIIDVCGVGCVRSRSDSRLATFGSSDGGIKTGAG